MRLLPAHQCRVVQAASLISVKKTARRLAHLPQSCADTPAGGTPGKTGRKDESACAKRSGRGLPMNR